MENLQGLLSCSSSSSSFFDEQTSSICSDCWLIAAQSTQEILSSIQPTVFSEQRRREVINFVRRLIRGYYGIEVLPFGSVPLKTYLPDGDIDLTAISLQNDEELATDICRVLESEDQKVAGFLVKDVQYIRAQVKIVKCSVQSIAVDISFNQLAGLGALCFLEQVDRHIGKDHLFKRSILLIKAWCYYESRILGAHHGLISTYALEILVLYIINLFHSSLHSPLEVLYRFLNYYSEFDWDKYCVSLDGPVDIVSLPEIIVKKEESDADDLLLTEEFLKTSRETLSPKTEMNEPGGQGFPIKYLNIMDPLKESNNLGRSVSKGNFYRIRYAFSYGAQKLREIVAMPAGSISEGVKKFFATTLGRNGRRQRPDIQGPIPVSGTERPEVYSFKGDNESYFGGRQHGKLSQNHPLPLTVQSISPTLQIWSSSVQMQLNWNIFPTINPRDFLPITFCHPRSPRLSDVALSGEEMMKFLGTGTYTHDMSVEEKLKLQGMGIFVPDMCVEEKLGLQGSNIHVEETVKLQGTGTFIPTTFVEKNLKSRGTCACIPRMSARENFKPQRTGKYVPCVGVEEKAKSGGTETYSPDLTRSSYMQMQPWVRGRSSEPVTQEILEYPLHIEKGEVSSQTAKGGTSSCFNMSLEEFPHLPGSKKTIPPAASRCCQTAEDHRAQESSPCLQRVEVGGKGLSLSTLLLPSLVSKHPDFGFSTTADSIQGTVTVETWQPPELSKGDDEMLLAQPYKLEDDEDFPPLSA